MMELKFFGEREIRELENSLKIEFGVEKIPGKIISFGREKLFLFGGEVNKGEILKIAKLVPVERVGVYFAKVIAGEVRLSIEGSQILKDQIKKNIFELNKEQMEKWMKGEELNIKTGKKGFLVMKYKDNFLGCGKASLEKIGNFIPKIRRLKNKNN